MGLKFLGSYPAPFRARRVSVLAPAVRQSAERILKALTDNSALQLVFYLQLLSFEFVNEVEVRRWSSFFFDENVFDFSVLGSKSFVPCVLTH